MLLADTVLVNEAGEQEILTGSISKRFGDVSYFIEVLLSSSFLSSWPLLTLLRNKTAKKSLQRKLL